MAIFVCDASLRPLSARSPISRCRSETRLGPGTRPITRCSGPAQAQPDTVFDLLYREYLPFRLYADYMLGSSQAELALHFGLPEQWVVERLEAVRLCFQKQVRLNLLDSSKSSHLVPL
jgi:hypothetical protein